MTQPDWHILPGRGLAGHASGGGEALWSQPTPHTVLSSLLLTFFPRLQIITGSGLRCELEVVPSRAVGALGSALQTPCLSDPGWLGPPCRLGSYLDAPPSALGLLAADVCWREIGSS